MARIVKEKRNVRDQVLHPCRGKRRGMANNPFLRVYRSRDRLSVRDDIVAGSRYVVRYLLGHSLVDGPFVLRVVSLQ